ncbi:hypothetical protein [Rhodoferax ferrireducens]|uniref:hypothetical protein n=1 Tax=Rhodoferax ferrireducens TaxID=192843 RepID=UPI000E0D648F|nr:hypothetical protein [Rhodoferax ferrireducens]
MARQKVHENAAARVAAYRQRHALVTLSVDIPQELSEAFEGYLKFKNLTKAAVISKLLRDQLLRKR